VERLWFLRQFAALGRRWRFCSPEDASRDASRFRGTVALRVDLVALQEIFRLTVAPSGQTAALSD